MGSAAVGRCVGGAKGREGGGEEVLAREEEVVVVVVVAVLMAVVPWGTPTKQAYGGRGNSNAQGPLSTTNGILIVFPTTSTSPP